MGVHLFKKLFLEGTGTSCSWSVLFIPSNRNMSISNWLLMVVDRLNLPWKFSIGQKSLYSYFQYYWWPIALIVKLKSSNSSITYNSNNEGIEIWIKMTMEIIIQKDLQMCASYKNLFINVINRVFKIRNQRKIITEKMTIIHINAWLIRLFFISICSPTVGYIPSMML